jgi:hypothetical protein
LRELTGYIRASREAGRFVAVGGPDAAVALHEAGGNVPKAQAWLSQARSERPSSSGARGGVGKSPGGGASLVDEPAGSTQKKARAEKASGTPLSR